VRKFLVGVLMSLVLLGTLAVALVLGDSPRPLWWRVAVLFGYIGWEAGVVYVSVWVYDTLARARGRHR
jgi:hypothetical protein